MQRKLIVWIGSSLDELSDFPDEIKRTMGYGLHLAQIGQKPLNAKPLRGFGGATVLEIIDEDPSGTYRAVYTVKYKDVIFVLHAFQKKSKQGIKTPKAEIDLIESRLKQAQEIYKEIDKKKWKDYEKEK